MLPPRRQKVRSGIERGPQREWPKHEQWVRGFECSVSNAECWGKIEFAHVRQDHTAGVGQKPPSWQGIPLCHYHHIHVQHSIGHEAFDKRYGVDSLKLAAELAAKSTDKEMIAAMSNPPTN